MNKGVKDGKQVLRLIPFTLLCSQKRKEVELQSEPKLVHVFIFNLCHFDPIEVGFSTQFESFYAS